MITRRQFAKFLGSAVVLSALKPELVWPSAAQQVSARAADLYRNSFILDCNTLASIGFQLTGDEQESKLKAVSDSGITALKSTLGGASGTFDQAKEDIAAAEELIEKRPDLFLKVRSYADLERAQKQRKVGVIYSFEAASCAGVK